MRRSNARGEGCISTAPWRYYWYYASMESRTRGDGFPLLRFETRSGGQCRDLQVHHVDSRVERTRWSKIRRI